MTLTSVLYSDPMVLGFPDPTPKRHGSTTMVNAITCEFTSV